MPKKASLEDTSPSNRFNLSAAELKEMAKKLRRHVITMTATAGSGHPGGSLSAADIITALYFRALHHDPENPQWLERDRFILSKGHAAPILYAALAEAGYFPVSELATLRRLDSRLQGHTDRNLTPGVEMSAGSLGIGLSFAIGVALAARLDSKTYRTYALLSDGECEEGETWEAALAATHFNLDNLRRKGLAKVKQHVLLSLTGMLVYALTAAKRGFESLVRSPTRLIA